MFTIKHNPDYYEWIEEGFGVLLENPNSKAGTDLIKKGAEHLYPYNFTIYVIHPSDAEELYVMSVFPNHSTIDKIVSAVSSNQSQAVVQKIWETNKDWTIEIDHRILHMGLSKRELTALLCHEIGHVIASNSITQRITNVLEYEVTKSKLQGKSMITHKLFSSLLSLPVLQACTTEKNGSVKKELEADKWAAKAGYRNDLLHAMQVFQKQTGYKNNQGDKDVKNVAKFSSDVMDQFKKRETALIEKALLETRDSIASPYIKESVQSIYDHFFTEVKGSTMSKDRKIDYFCEQANRSENEEEVFQEFFGFKRSIKPMKAIDRNELDYISIKIPTMKTPSDQMMLCSYCNNKLDIVNYYLSIYENPDFAAKAPAMIPHSYAELKSIKDRLEQNIKTILNYKLPNKNQGLLVAWPDGYDG